MYPTNFIRKKHTLISLDRGIIEGEDSETAGIWLSVTGKLFPNATPWVPHNS